MWLSVTLAFVWYYNSKTVSYIQSQLIKHFLYHILLFWSISILNKKEPSECGMSLSTLLNTIYILTGSVHVFMSVCFLSLLVRTKCNNGISIVKYH